MAHGREQYEGPVGPAARTSALEIYEWLTGGFFLIHRFQGRVGDRDAACIEVIGHDARTQTYPIHTFYNNGIAQQWESRESDGIWTLTGLETEMTPAYARRVPHRNSTPLSLDTP